jgi:hypothetical protein
MPIHLIILILGLVIAVAGLFGSPSAINFDKYRVILDSRSMNSSVSSLMISRNNYQVEFKKELDSVKWKSDFRKSGNPVPILKGYKISYSETDGIGSYFCISTDSVSGTHRTDTLIKSLELLESYTVYLNDSCGVIANYDAVNEKPKLFNSLSLTVYTGS